MIILSLNLSRHTLPNEKGGFKVSERDNIDEFSQDGYLVLQMYT
jgi:hypothetical protein